MPAEIAFATKPEIAMEQLRSAKAQAVPVGVVLADAAYGTNTAWRDGRVALDRNHAVGVVGSAGVWPPGVLARQGPSPVRHRHTPDRQPGSVEAFALSRDRRACKTVRWREGSNAPWHSRLAARPREAGTVFAGGRAEAADRRGVRSARRLRAAPPARTEPRSVAGFDQRRLAGAYDRNIDVQQSRLWRKIETDPNQPVLIKTVLGGGYLFAPCVERKR